MKRLEKILENSTIFLATLAGATILTDGIMRFFIARINGLIPMAIGVVVASLLTVWIVKSKNKSR